MDIVSEDRRSAGTAVRWSPLRAAARPAAAAPLPRPRPLRRPPRRLPGPASPPARQHPPASGPLPGPDSRPPAVPLTKPSQRAALPQRARRRGREAGKGRRREGERKPLAGADPTRTHIPAPPPGNAVRTGGAGGEAPARCLRPRTAAAPGWGGAGRRRPPARGEVGGGRGLGGRGGEGWPGAPSRGVRLRSRPGRGRSEGGVAGGLCLPGRGGFPSGFLRRDPGEAHLPSPRVRCSPLRFLAGGRSASPHLPWKTKPCVTSHGLPSGYRCRQPPFLWAVPIFLGFF